MNREGESLDADETREQPQLSLTIMLIGIGSKIVDRQEMRILAGFC